MWRVLLLQNQEVDPPFYQQKHQFLNAFDNSVKVST